MPSLSSFIFAQAANATNAATAAGAADPSQQQSMPLWGSILMWVPLVGLGYFLLIRPQSVAAKKQGETLKGAKTGDKIITSSGIHGVISNVKDSTFIVKIADNVKIEVEKSAIDKVTRASADPAPAKA